jgi:hypothetical protein
MSTPKRTNRKGDSQGLPKATTGPIAHELVQNDLQIHATGRYVEDLDELYDSLMDGAILVRSKMRAAISEGYVQTITSDLDARLKLGIERYGQPLQPFNGRNMLLDAYEEILDALVYLRAALYEADHEQKRQYEADHDADPLNPPGPGDKMIEVKQMAVDDDPTPIKRAEP